jgi:hypothetical protein
MIIGEQKMVKILCAALVITSSWPPNQQAANAYQQSKYEQRETFQKLSVIKFNQSEQTQEKSNSATSNRPNQGNNAWFCHLHYSTLGKLIFPVPQSTRPPSLIARA